MNKVPRWVFRYVGNKTFDFSSKKRIFCPKTTKFGIFVHCWIIWCWVGWWLWRAGCISQDTYLLYLYILLTFFCISCYHAFSYSLSSLYLRLQPTMCQHCLAAGRSPPIIANEATNKLSHSGHTARCCTRTFSRLSLFWSLSSS